MYKKYFHSKDKVSSEPVNEDFGTAIAAGVGAMGIGAALIGLSARAANKKSNPTDFKLRKSKGGKFTPDEAIEKSETIFNKVLSKAIYKKLKAEFADDCAERYDPKDLSAFNNDLAMMGNFYFHAARSEAEEKYLIDLLNKFIEDLNNQFHKLDRTYSFEKYYGDGYWWVRFVSDMK